jgi:hypothetical protein
LYETKKITELRPSTLGKVSFATWSHDMKIAAKKEVYNELVSDNFYRDIMHRDAC